MKRLLFIPLMVWGCSKAPVIQAVKVTSTSVESTVTTISAGTVKAENQASLAFGATGRVQSIYVQVGQRVKKGILLAEIENRDLKSTAETMRKEVDRSSQLKSNGMISQAAFDEARRASDVAHAAYERSVIRAPFDGIVTEVNLKLGEMASSGLNSATPGVDKPPLRIVDDKARLIEGDIDELDLGKVKIGQAVRVRIPAANNRRVVGKVTSTVPFINSTREQDRTSKIEIRLDEEDPSIPVGASAEVEIIVDRKDKALVLPSRAILGVGQQKYVFKVQNDILVKTPVTLGLGNYERREVATGLAEGDLAALPGSTVEYKDQLKVKAEVQTWMSSN